MSPIAGIVDAQNLKVSSGHTPSFSGHFGMPVIFNSTILANGGLTSTDGAYISFSGWFKVAWGGPVAWAVDPLGNYDMWLGQGGRSPNFAIGSAASAIYESFVDQIIDTPHWHHIIGTARGDIPNHPRFSIFCSGVDKTGAPFILGSGPSVPLTNGLPFFVGSDGGNDFNGEMADLSIWPGVSFFNGGETAIDPHILAAFRDPVHGTPVDPLVAIALLGTPAIMLTGNASEFPSNALGSGGPFTVTQGTLTDGVDLVAD